MLVHCFPQTVASARARARPRSQRRLQLFLIASATRSAGETASVFLGTVAKEFLAMASFVDVAGSQFSLQNLPYGVFRPSSGATPRPGVAIGDSVVDLSVLSEAGLFTGPLLSPSTCFSQVDMNENDAVYVAQLKPQIYTIPGDFWSSERQTEETSLNAFMALGRPAWKEARATLQKLLSADVPTLRDNKSLRSKAIVSMSQVKMELPAVIGDYTDFFSSKEHAVNCGTLFRSKEEALPPNWLHVPIAYHGRASSVVISGTDIKRPRGQTSPPVGQKAPEFKPSALLDFEMEMAVFVGPGNELGTTVSVDDAADHIFGFVLMNDWSARDIQKWEYIPLGPFLGKSFGTTISPWIVTLEALEPFICDAPEQDPPALPYLTEKKRVTYDIPLQVAIKPEGASKASVICNTNFRYLYWTVCQQLAHHTINGCNLNPGDLLASGTISGPDSGSMGSMLEMSVGGSKEIKLEHGGGRRFLQDGDEVIMSAVCQGDGFSVGFGECKGKVLPAKVHDSIHSARNGKK